MSFNSDIKIIDKILDCDGNKEDLATNRLYGGADILKIYTGLKINEMLNGVLMHGWTLYNGLSDLPLREDIREDKRNRFFSTRRYVWSKRNLESHESLGFNNVVCIGAPFLYLPKIAYVEPVKPKSIIFFPIHSTNREYFYNPIKFFRTYLKQIIPILDKFDSHTICLGMYDYADKDIIDIFKDFNVVCIGNKFDTDFLIKYQNLVNRYSYVSSNEFSTAIMYALHMGKKVFIRGNPGKSYKPDQAYMHSDGVKPPVWRKHYKQILWSNFDNKCHNEISDIELGLEYKKSVDELREILNERK